MTKLMIADKMPADNIQRLMLGAFQGQTHLVGQGRYIIINVSPWIYYQNDVKLEEEAV